MWSGCERNQTIERGSETTVVRQPHPPSWSTTTREREAVATKLRMSDGMIIAVVSITRVDVFV